MAETGLTVRFERTGRTISQETGGIKEWEIDSSYIVSTDAFSFTLYAPDDPELTADALLLEPVELLVNGASQGFFRIEVTDVGDDGTAITCKGRDYISELVECNVDPYKKFTADTSLGDALLDVMRPVGIQTITDFENVILTSIRSGLKLQSGPSRKPSSDSQQKRNQEQGTAARALAGLDKAGTKKPPPPPPRQRVNPISQKIKDFQPKPGEGIYECANRLCARFGVTIQPSVSRSDICLDAPDYAASPLFKLLRTKDTTASAGNNIKSGSATRDYTRFPTFAVFTGTSTATTGKTRTPLGMQLSTLDLAKALGVDELATILERATTPLRVGSNDIDSLEQADVLYRLLYFRDEDSKTQEQIEYAARRAIADRLKDTLSYSCSVAGHVDPVSGGVWSVGAMVEVSDAVTNVHENLWLASRKLTYSGEGPMTSLELLRPGTWAINEEV